MKLKINLMCILNPRDKEKDPNMKILDDVFNRNRGNSVYELHFVNELNNKIIASTRRGLGHSYPIKSWIEYVSNYYKKHNNAPEYLEVEEVSGYINIYKETIPLDVVLVFFNEHGKFKGYRLVRSYSLEDVRKLCLNAFYEGAENEKHGLTFEDWCKNNL